MIRFFKSYFLILCLPIFLLGSVSCSKQSASSGYADARGAQKSSKTKKKRSKDRFDGNTTRNFKPKSARQLRKEARMKSKPQYTDPMYFGHKKPPKKRPPGKRKYCKECGMWH